jgi:predicted esterase
MRWLLIVLAIGCAPREMVWHSARVDVAATSELYRGVPADYELVLPRQPTGDLALIVLPAHPSHPLHMRGFLEHLVGLGHGRVAVMVVHAANVAYARSPELYRQHMADPEAQRDATAIVLAAVGDALRRNAALSAARVSCFGWSGSANECWMLATDAPRTFAAIDVVSSGYNPTTPGSDFEKLRCTSVRIEQGGRDRIVTVERPRAAAARLRELGADVVLVEHPNSDHSDMSDELLAAAVEWLAARSLRRC